MADHSQWGRPLPDRPGLAWLGQAGFWIETGAHQILVDPYLSDSLAKKYAGQPMDHIRLMPPPVSPAQLPRPGIVLVTHAHTDHMDGETLAPIAARFPDLPFVVPAAREAQARARIGAAARLVAVDAGDVIEPLDGLQIHVMPAAHETRERDAAGRHLFLGYGIVSGGHRIYHSGDTVPFNDLTSAVAAFAPQLTLLPVNGRSAALHAAGVPGNMTLDEAIGMTRAVGARRMVAHHFGMFAFNTLDPDLIDRAAAATHLPTILRPRIGRPISLAFRGMKNG